MTRRECGMEETTSKPACGKPNTNRPVRNRRYSRRAFVAGQRPAKRLFTPEIKRFLKDWLVRRRDNPYPNREEKKFLANETGLTYVQICNWFANWRRKLKNVNAERRRKTWGHLIKTYNDRAQGNVEQFSICSEDSIWGETDRLSVLSDEYYDDQCKSPNRRVDTGIPVQDQQCYQVSSTTEDAKLIHVGSNNNTYAKTALDVASEETCVAKGFSERAELSGALLLSKWLESAARFQPSESNYGCWSGRGRGGRAESAEVAARTRHGRDEVEAAVALTALASAAAALVHTSTSSSADNTREVGPVAARR